MSLSEDDKQWMTTQLDTLREAVETRFDTKLEALETRLLRAFHDWASPVEMRAKSLACRDSRS